MDISSSLNFLFLKSDQVIELGSRPDKKCEYNFFSDPTLLRRTSSSTLLERPASSAEVPKSFLVKSEMMTG